MNAAAYRVGANERLSRRQFLGRTGLLTLAVFLPPVRIFSHPDVPFVCLKRSRLSMGSLAEITLYGNTRSQSVEAITAAFAEFDRVERLMSVFDTSSQVSRVNQCAGEQEVQVDENIIELLRHARWYHDLSDGAFDVTVEPLMRFYGFRDENTSRSMPSDRQIAAILDGVGMKKVMFDERHSTVLLTHHTTKLDFGGIAVGYAVDRAIGILKSYDVESALINHSGDIFALGAPPGSDTWTIEISDPHRPEETLTTVRIKDGALSTSGNYRKFVEADGKTIGHILDPHTGVSPSEVTSGTVIANNAIEADALSTAFFVMGVEKARTVVRDLCNIEFLAAVGNGDDTEIVRLASP